MPGSGTLAPPSPCCNGATCARGIPPAPCSQSAKRQTLAGGGSCTQGALGLAVRVLSPDTPEASPGTREDTQGMHANAHSVLVFRAESHCSALQMGSPEAAWRHRCPSSVHATQPPSRLGDKTGRDSISS